MLHPDFKDLLAAFAESSVRYLLIGGYAVAFYGRPRFTKDLDLWIGDDPANVQHAIAALSTFGAPIQVIEAMRTARADEIVYMGAPPVRIDILRQIPGAEFDDAYARRVTAEIDGVSVAVIDRRTLIAAKRAAGRPQDVIDVEALEQVDAG